MYFSMREQSSLSRELLMINIIYQDDSLIVIDKPPGLVSTPSDTQTDPTLADILKNELGVSLERGGLVHRLDKDTSGLILAAKTPESFENLQSQFGEREVKKEYLALVHGFTPEKGEVKGAIARNPGDREKFIVMEDLEMGFDKAREASTEYKVEERLQLTEDRLQEIFEGFSKIQFKKLNNAHYNLFTLLRCFPKTGRTHQIRVHLKYLGHSIVGDAKYGGRKTVRLDHRWCARQFLHAAKISFKHPKSGKQMIFESPLPEDLTQALSCLTLSD
jgi:23S rRNA pseudouridine1911/1915/1917 synthase